MSRIISLHEYELKREGRREAFEEAILKARHDGLLKLSGLEETLFLKGIRGKRREKFASLWIYPSRESWERIWGPAENPRKKDDYPENWKIWENEVLAPFLSQAPHKIAYTAYEEF